MCYVEKRKRLEFRFAVTQHFLVDGIGGQEVAFVVGQRNADGGILKDGAPSLLALAKCFLRLLSITNVFGGHYRIAARSPHS